MAIDENPRRTRVRRYRYLALENVTFLHPQNTYEGQSGGRVHPSDN